MDLFLAPGVRDDQGQFGDNQEDQASRDSISF